MQLDARIINWARILCFDILVVRPIPLVLLLITLTVDAILAEVRVHAWSVFLMEITFVALQVLLSLSS